MESKAANQGAKPDNRAGSAVMLGLTLAIVGAILAPIIVSPESRSFAEAAFRFAVAAPWAVIGLASMKQNNTPPVDMQI